MFDRLEVQLVFQGTPFDKRAVLHVMRHLAMRVGWTFTQNARHRIIYTTGETQRKFNKQSTDLLIFSHSGVEDYLRKPNQIIPFVKEGDQLPLPFPHPAYDRLKAKGVIAADVVAGSLALLNLMYESSMTSLQQDGGIKFQDDWWAKAGFHHPEALVDQWLDLIAIKAEEMDWPTAAKNIVFDKTNRGCVVLTHDVDYLPTPMDMGVPRLLRAVARQLIIRKRPMDALSIVKKFCFSFPKREFGGSAHTVLPYNELQQITSKEKTKGAVSTFQFIVANHHKSDPIYEISDKIHVDELKKIIAQGFEICLHGSYIASRNPGQLTLEKKRLEQIIGSGVSGIRQHYLNFHPDSFFREVENAKFNYDMSIGYNDCSGPRAGTYYPYKPFNLEKSKPFSFWEIPFILMDTTLATTYCFNPVRAFEHCKNELEKAIQTKGIISIIWHQEQFAGTLDYQFDQIYWQVVEWLTQRTELKRSGHEIVQDLQTAWENTLSTTLKFDGKHNIKKE